MAMDRQEFLDLAPAHALGLLEGAERERFEAALRAADPGLKAAYAQAVRTASHLSLAAPEAPLSPDVKDRLMARIGAASTGAPSPSAPRASRPPDPATASPKPRVAFLLLPLPVWAGVAAAAVILCAALVSQLAAVRGDLAGREAALQSSRQRITALEDSLAQKEALLEVIRAEGMQLAVMAGQDASPGGYGKILWDPARKRAILHVSNLPPIPADKDYQLWVIRDAKPVDAGVFHVSAAKPGGDLFRIESLVEADRSRINAFAVTLEPKGGLPQPSGKMYLLGSI